MGYTHYWKNKAEFSTDDWLAFTVLAQKIVNLAEDSGIPIAGGMGTGKPEYKSEYISLNGAAPNDYETFSIARGASDFGFCKTQYRPYDAVVVALLMAASACSESFEWSSDGSEADHAEGLALYESAKTALLDLMNQSERA